MSGVFSLLSRAASIKLKSITEHKQQPVHTAVPLGLTQGAAIKLDQSYQLFLLGAGTSAMMPKIEENQSVIAVGVLKLYGRVDPNRPLAAQSAVTLYRSYLSDQRSFIQTMAKDNRMVESSSTQLFTMQREDPLSTPEERDQLLGADGFLGLEQIDFDTASGQAARFNRAWEPGAGRRAPHFASEVITTLDGEQTRMLYHTMMYGRTLSLGGKDSMSEYMYLNRYVNMGNDLTSEIMDVDLAQVLECYFIQSTGVDMAPSNIKVYSPT